MQIAGCQKDHIYRSECGITHRQVERKQENVFGNGLQESVTIFFGEGVDGFIRYLGRCDVLSRIFSNPFHPKTELEELFQAFALHRQSVSFHSPSATELRYKIWREIVQMDDGGFCFAANSNKVGE